VILHLLLAVALHGLYKSSSPTSNTDSHLYLEVRN